MRVGENLSAGWQNLAAALWILGYGLCFLAAISALWGWLVMGWVSCVVLIVLCFEERKAISFIFSKKNIEKNDRFFAWYVLIISSAAVLINLVLIGLWGLSYL